jgi:hypothetical protein
MNNNINVKQACPRCQGAGFIHINDEIKHDKAKNVKCKNCRSCSIKGWLHDSPHPHDASDNIRCFYCRTCPGIKVFFNKKLIAIVIVNYYLFFTY